jgi:transcriptional regulator with XRE-family HTH domain
MNLKQAREALGWTQEELSRRSGVGQQHISKLEKGRIERISYLTVVRIVRALRKAGLAGVTAEKLFPVLNGEDGK